MDGIKMDSCNLCEFTFSVIHSRQQVTYGICYSKMFMHAFH